MTMTNSLLAIMKWISDCSCNKGIDVRQTKSIGNAQPSENLHDQKAIDLLGLKRKRMRNGMDHSERNDEEKILKVARHDD